MTVKHLVHWFLVSLVFFMTMSCEHHDLCYHHEHIVRIRLEFDWCDAPDADPLGMVVFFYPEGECRSDENIGAGTIRLDLRGKHGAEIDIPVGAYRIIAYNNDTEACFGIFTDIFSQHRIHTRNAWITVHAQDFVSDTSDLPRPDGTADQPVVDQPDQIWGCSATDVIITEHGIKYKCFPLEEKEDWIGLPPVVTENVITLYPHDLVCHYSYEIRNVKGMSLVRNLCAAITGMSPAFVMADMMQASELTTIPLPAVRSDDNTIKGEFLTFGHPIENNDRHHMALYAWMSTSPETRKKTSRAYEAKFFGNTENFDVTLQCDTASDQRHVHLIIDGLDFTNGNTELPPGSYNPDFGEWEEENFDITI